MSDDRWVEVAADIASAVRHFTMSVELWDRNGLDQDKPDQYWSQMGLMHAMQSGHTSLEAALLRILDMLGETAPTGAQWHADLINRAGKPTRARPAILTDALVEAAGETRRFRHIAMRGYDKFKKDRAAPGIAAARLLASGLGGDIDAFRLVIDP